MPPTPPTADICLVLEGTYPYVSGGVSTWVHQIIQMFPQWSFAILYLGAQRDPAAKYKYELPKNLIAIEEIYLFQDGPEESKQRGKLNSQQWQPVFEAVRKLGVRPPNGEAHEFELLRAIMGHVTAHPEVTFDTFWNSEDTWGVVHELYDRYAHDESFLDFYWTTCFLIQPLWRLARGLARLPRAQVYHTACTGYAGIAAALASAQNQQPLVLTEHGIYLRERIADICRSPWIPDQLVQRPNLNEPLGSLRRLWIGFFDVVGRMCYHQSRTIVSLFDNNARAQQHFGADPAKITIIPNGIRTEHFATLMEKRAARRAADPGTQIVGFLGRVVSIKDVKTLLRTARKVCNELPNARFLIAGPTEEEPEYYEQCIDLTLQLGVQTQVEFLGPTKRDEFLPQLDLMILTSYSEGLPFVIIESLAAGVPVVSTDVGACSELLNGRRTESPAFGPAGLIAEVGNSDELATACVRLLTNDTELDAMTTAGLQRVESLYHEDAIKAAYQQVYEDCMAGEAQREGSA